MKPDFRAADLSISRWNMLPAVRRNEIEDRVGRWRPVEFSFLD